MKEQALKEKPFFLLIRTIFRTGHLLTTSRPKASITASLNTTIQGVLAFNCVQHTSGTLLIAGSGDMRNLAKLEKRLRSKEPPSGPKIRKKGSYISSEQN